MIWPTICSRASAAMPISVTVQAASSPTWTPAALYSFRWALTLSSANVCVLGKAPG